MGYTHYFTQLRDFTAAEWEQAAADIGAILANAQQRWEIPLGNWDGKRGTSPDFTPAPNARIAFNGWGDEGHETFSINQRRPTLDDDEKRWGFTRGAGFTKTARKPYDTAVTAVLCYLSNFHKMGELDEQRRPILEATSDGRGADFLKGLELARQALPHMGNVLDLPLGVMERDRWCAPWVDVKCKAYTFNFCVDGFAYVTRVKDGETFRFHTHRDAAEWAESFRERTCRVECSWSRLPSQQGGASLFNAMGSFNAARISSIGRQQTAAFRWLFDYHWTDTAKARGELGPKPPAFIRPGQMVEEERRPYSMAELLKTVKAAA